MENQENVQDHFDSEELMDEEPENESFEFVNEDEILEEDEMELETNNVDNRQQENIEEPKKEKKKKASKKAKVSNSKTVEISLDDSSDDLVKKLNNLVKECNNKSIGRKIVIDDVLKYIVEKLVEPNREQCIFDIQKLSLTQDELDNILKNSFIQ